MLNHHNQFGLIYIYIHIYTYNIYIHIYTHNIYIHIHIIYTYTYIDIWIYAIIPIYIYT